MVLNKMNKSLILVALLYLGKSIDVYAVSVEDKKIFQKAKDFFKNRDYQKSLDHIKDHFNIKDSNVPVGALTLAGFNYEKLGELKKAKNIYQYVLKRNYREQNKIIMDAFKNEKLDDIVGKYKRVYIIYHRFAEVMSLLYITQYEKLEESLKQSYKDKALRYVSILEEIEYEDDSYDVIAERFEKFEQELKARQYKSRWYLESSYVSWKDQFQLNSSAGSKLDIEATSEGTCLGAGWRYYNAYWEYGLNGCYAIASGTAAKTPDSTSSLDYSQSGITTTALFLGPTIMYRPKSNNSGFGIHLPAVWRKGEYSVPEPDLSTGTTYSIEGSSLFTLGVVFQGEWSLESWGINTKFGKILKGTSTFWSIGFSYNL